MLYYNILKVYTKLLLAEFFENAMSEISPISISKIGLERTDFISD